MSTKSVAFTIITLAIGAFAGRVFSDAKPAVGITLNPSTAALTADELASAMGCKMWKLQATLPEGVAEASVLMRWRDKAGQTTDIVRLPAPLSFAHRDLVIGVIPAAPDGKDSKLRFSLQSAGGATTIIESDHLSTMNTYSANPQPVSPGVFRLIGGSRRGFDAMEKGDFDESLELVIEPVGKEGK